MKRLIFILLCAAAARLSAYDIVGSVFVTTGAYADVKNAVNDSTAAGSVYAVAIPPGTHTGYGVGGQINVDGPVHIYGAGRTETILVGTTGSPTIFNVTAGALIEGFTFNGGGSGTIIFNVTGTPGTNIGARWNDLKLDFSGNMGSRMFLIDRVYGVVYNCEFWGGAANNEYIYMRGPTDAWDYPANMGTDQAFYVEDCFFAGPPPGNNRGYTDSNACGRMVFRMNVIQAASKLDAHGIESNSLPTRSSRLVEYYGNRWTWTSTSVGSMVAIEHRGGSGIVFDNIIDATAPVIGIFAFNQYAMTGQWVNAGGYYNTPYHYPIADQIGAGPGTIEPGAAGGGTGTQEGGAEPVYFFSNKKNHLMATASRSAPAAPTFYRTDAAGYAAGVSTITITGVSTGNGFNTGNYFTLPGDPTYYLVTSPNRSSSPAVITFTPALVNPIPAAVTTLGFGGLVNHRGLTGNPLATYVADDVLKFDRDLFVEVASFNGTTGVGVGPGSAMATIAANGLTKKIGAGYWATDEGNWNQSFFGTVSVSTIEAGDYCEIVTPGDTNFTLMGARNSLAGTWFVATGPGSGSGMVKPRQGNLYIWNGTAFELKFTPYTYPHPLRGGSEPPSGPTITDQPDSLAVTVGAPASFSVTATTSGGTLTYQWRKAGVSISGATSSTYMIPATVTGDAGSYSVVVTDDNSPAFSSFATLTVDEEEPEEPEEPTPADRVRSGTRKAFSGFRF